MLLLTKKKPQFARIESRSRRAARESSRRVGESRGSGRAGRTGFADPRVSPGLANEGPPRITFRRGDGRGCPICTRQRGNDRAVSVTLYGIGSRVSDDVEEWSLDRDQVERQLAQVLADERDLEADLSVAELVFEISWN